METTDSESENDEGDWELDEVIDAYDEPPDYESSESDTGRLVQGYLAAHPAPAAAQAVGRLPLPIVIPQRRPGTKRRGFVRAYAPGLEECGIDQEMFLDFLKAFHMASRVCVTCVGRSCAHDDVDWINRHLQFSL